MKNLSDSEIVASIQALLDGTTWTVDLLDEIAVLLDDNGYKIGEPIE